MAKRFYVYTLARPGGKVFYVGKGQGKRIEHHEREARSSCRCHKCNIIRKVWRLDGEIKKEIVFTCGDETEALAKEANLIDLFGLAALANVRPGRRMVIVPRSGSGRVTINDATYLAHLRKRGVGPASRKAIMSEWHEQKIDELNRRRRHARLNQDDYLYAMIGEEIDARSAALGLVEQLSFDTAL